VKLAAHLHLVSRLMRGAIPSLPHTSSWRVAYLSTGTPLPFAEVCKHGTWRLRVTNVK
jgi:hypothetical protein